MKVEINIEETAFKELLEGHLNNLPEDTIEDIIVESIKGYFTQNNYEKIENLFFDKKHSNYYGYSETCANSFLEGLVKNCDYSKLQDVLDAAIKNITDNHEKILRDIFIEAIIDQLSNKYSFQCNIRNSLAEFMRR